LRKFSKKFKLPSWWVRYSIIEYEKCRYFFEDTEIWSFDFDLVDNKELENIPSLKIIIPASCILYHRVDPNTLWDTMAKKMTGKEAEPLNPDIIVEGLAEEDMILMEFNNPMIWDPKLAFNDRCLVLDQHEIYQWEIAAFEPIPGKIRGWHKSKVPELPDNLLQSLKTVNDKIDDLRNRRTHEKNVNIKELRTLAEKYYAELETARKPIRENLLKYHTRKVDKDVSR